MRSDGGVQGPCEVELLAHYVSIEEVPLVIAYWLPVEEDIACSVPCSIPCSVPHSVPCSILRFIPCSIPCSIADFNVIY